MFEPFTEWITKGKMKPSVELGLKLLVTTDQCGIVIDYNVMQKSSDSAENIAIESNINGLEHHGLNRCPDKGFHGFKRYAGFYLISVRQTQPSFNGKPMPIKDVIVPFRL